MMRYLLLCLLILNTTVGATVDTFQFSSSQNQRTALQLAKELRCPECQNQNLLESNSPVAKDMRLEVYALVEQGVERNAVIEQMTQRYGDFVRYKPPLKTSTLLLWFLPVILSIGALLLILFRYNKTPPVVPPTAQIQTNPDEHSALINQKTFSVPSQWLIFLICLLVALTLYAFSDRYQSLTTGLEQQKITDENSEKPLSAYIGKLYNKLQETPLDAALWLEISQAYLYHNAFTQALYAIEQAISLQGETSLNLSAKATILYYQAGQTLTQDIVHLLDSSLQKNPNEVTALMLFASDHFMNARYQQAITYWQRALDSGDSRINRGTLIEAINTARMLDQQ